MGCEAITQLWREAARRVALYYYEAALRQIWPLHPDVPAIVHRVAELRRTK